MAVKIVEAFSGAGGFSALLGRQFDVGMALDIDPQAEAVYLKNRPGTRFIRADITQIKDFRQIYGTKPDIMLAGPPCQGFSPVGMKTKKRLSKEKGYDPATGPRNLLPLEIPRMAEQLKPAAVIMENVPAMNVQQVNMKGRISTVPELVREGLESSGYDVSEPFILNAHDIGVPQKRRRSFIVAVQSPGIDPDEVARLAEMAAVQKQRASVGISIGDLAGHPVATPAAWRSATFPDHVGRVPNIDDIRIIHNLRPGESYASLVARLPDVLEGRSHRIYGTCSFGDKFYRLRPDVPSKTVVAHLQKDGNSFIHPFLDRSISVREAARIQSFPDSFIFGVPMGHAYRLVGNAVPPLVGKFLVETVARITGLIDDREAAAMEFASMVA